MSWHSAADVDRLKMLGVGLKVEAVIREEMCTEKREEGWKVTCERDEKERK